MGQTRDQLAERVAKGDQEALTELLGDLTPELQRRIAARINPAHRASIDAEDILQVTFIEAYLRIDSFTSGGESGFTAWIARIAENNLKDAIRALSAAKRPNPSARVRRAANAPESYDTLIGALGATTATPSRDAALHEAYTELEKAIDSLPRDYATVIRALDLENRDIEEVARELGRSKGAVHMLRARAHDRLRDAMGSQSRYFSIG